MSNLLKSPVSTSRATRPPFTRSLAEITVQNEAVALSVARGQTAATTSRVGRRLAAGTGAVVAAAAFLAFTPSAAEARVLPVAVATAHQGPVVVPSGAVRCKGKGDFHVTLTVRTTTKDRKGDHHVSVWVQEHQGGRARLAGYAWSTGRAVKVTACINPGRIDGARGPVYVIVEDDVDGYTRPVEVRFPGAK